MIKRQTVKEKAAAAACPPAPAGARNCNTDLLGRPQPPPRTPRAEPVAAPVIAQPVSVARTSGGGLLGALGYVVAAGYGAAKILYYLVIVYFVFVAIALVWWFFTTVLPWMQRILQ